MRYIEYEKNINSDNPFNIVLGEKEDGTKYSINLCEAPHILLAGCTGSGKSVLINSILLSIMNNCSPSLAKFILVDYKMVEFSCMSDSEYLYMPIIHHENKSLDMLNDLYEVMEERYRLLSNLKTRNLNEYNKVAKEPLPYLFVVFDEVAFYGEKKYEFEEKISKIIQKSRAAGIHFILGTQRPSMLKFSASFKANIPTRICLRVVTLEDSKIMLGCSGGESLEHKGLCIIKDSCGKMEKILSYYVNECEFEKYLR